MKISEVAKLTGITVRALHYYDEIGLLKPSEITESGYRIYSEECLDVLQQILFFRELEFPLNEIKEIMTNPNYNKDEALNKHRELLIKKKERIDGLINLLDSKIEGGVEMSFKEFDMTEIENSKKTYAKEVKERWGKTDAYKESERKTKSYDADKWKSVQGEGDKILAAFGEIKDLDPRGKEAQELVQSWKDYISSSFYECTNEILSGLGLMYVEDERFKNNIDKNGEGTAEFISQAIKVYCSNN